MLWHACTPIVPAGIGYQINWLSEGIGTGPYRLVRHPLYLGWVLMVWNAATMTGDRLAFGSTTGSTTGSSWGWTPLGVATTTSTAASPA